MRHAIGRRPFLRRLAVAASALALPRALLAATETARLSPVGLQLYTVRRELATVEGYKRLADRFNRAGETASAAGIRFGYHNYTYDLTKAGDAFLYDVLLAETDPRYVAMQMDVYWLVEAGQDPLTYLTRHRGRYRSLHLKDLSADKRMADVGAGTILILRFIAGG